MSLPPGPAGERIAGEPALASYRGGELVLTDRRILHRTRAGDAVSLRLADVSAFGVGRRRARSGLLVVPLGLFLLGFLAALVAEDAWPLGWGAVLGLFALPLPWLGGRLVVYVAAPGHVLRVRVPRRHRDAARDFIRQVTAARFAEAAGPEKARAPTTTAFRG